MRPLNKLKETVSAGEGFKYPCASVRFFWGGGFQPSLDADFPGVMLFVLHVIFLILASCPWHCMLLEMKSWSEASMFLTLRKAAASSDSP